MAKDLSQFLQEVKFQVKDEDVDLRLDHFLVDKIFWRSRSDLQARIKRGAVLLEGKTTKPSSRLKLGDEVVVIVSPEDLPDQDPRDITIETIFENDQVIVVNKQAGVLVHPIGRHVYDTLMNALHLRFRHEGKNTEPHVVHRLDRDTSGVLVVAKNQEAKQHLQQIFQNRHPRKEYLALVEGVIQEDKGEITASLGPDEKAEIRIKMCVRKDGQKCRSLWHVVERFPHHTLVRVAIETGRQHQIRLHLRHIGFPVVADPLYGDPRSVGRLGEEPILERQALHAALLELQIPGAPGAQEFQAPLPQDMADVVEILRAGESLVQSRDVQSSRWRRA